MKVIKGEHGSFLVNIKGVGGQYNITVWDNSTIDPLGRLLANQSFFGDAEEAKELAAEMLADLSAEHVHDIRHNLSWYYETALKYATK